MQGSITNGPKRTLVEKSIRSTGIPSITFTLYNGYHFVYEVVMSLDRYVEAIIKNHATTYRSMFLRQ